MSDSKNPLLPSQLVDLLVTDILQRNGVKLDNAKEKISDDQKRMLKELVQNLSQQVDSFVKSPSSKKE